MTADTGFSMKAEDLFHKIGFKVGLLKFLNEKRKMLTKIFAGVLWE